MEIRKHDKQDFEIKCPNCGSEDISEITGWCYNHHNPTFEEDRPFCSKLDECGFISVIKNALFCNQCDTMYDKNKMANWNWNSVEYGNCPVGEEISEETPEEYSESLLDLMSTYSEEDIDNCLRDGHIIEAVVITQKHLAEQIRIILIRKIMGESNLENKEKQVKMVSFLKELKEEQILEISLIYDIINIEQKSKIKAINTLRNKLCHAFNLGELSAYSEKQKKNIIGDARKISQILDKIIFQQN
jgi:hypothetical protein